MTPALPFPLREGLGSAKLSFDLPGPKLRTGRIQPGPAVGRSATSLSCACPVVSLEVVGE